MQKKKMKKKADWLTKSKKRKIKQKDRGIVEIMMLTHHFFKELPLWLNEMTDPRNPSYTTYSQAESGADGCLEKYVRCKKYAFAGRRVQ